MSDDFKIYCLACNSSAVKATGKISAQTIGGVKYKLVEYKCLKCRYVWIE